jgi:hypothetical protein
MPYRLRRSPLFWTGLLIALFLAFAWRDSHTGYQSGLSLLDDGPQMATLKSSGSAVRGWLKWEIRGNHPSPAHRWITFRNPVLSRQLSDPFPAFSYHNDPYHGKSRSIAKNGEPFMEDDTIYQADFALPYWMILSAYLPLWGLLLFWRARRQNALVKKAAHGPVATAAP